MIQDMRLRNLAPKTQEEYVRWVSKFARFYHRSPLQLGPEEIRGWLVHLVENEKKSVSSYTVAAASLRFLYVQTLGRQWALRYIPLPKREKKLPDVLSEVEVAGLLDAPLTLKELAVISATYGGGLRTTEVSRLKVTDVDGRRMVIKIVQGKGRKDRYVALSKRLLEDLREYWKESRPSTWLFPNREGTGPISADSVRRICSKAAHAAGLGKRLNPRTLRHCFATHLHERGEALSKIGLAMGHRSVRTTSIYARIATSSVCAMESPLDRLPQLP
jgi:site-specific recombinase XerD